MKKKLTHIAKSALALGLAVCMVFNSSVTAYANGNDSSSISKVADVNGDGEIKYVSFGDSVTNGYGLDGYRFADGGNIVGFKREVPTAYPALIRDELARQYGAENVDLEQLAISGFRMDELHWLLDKEGYVADDYHEKWFDTWFDNLVSKWKRYGGEEKGNDLEDYYAKYDDTMTSEEVLRAEYVDAVKSADLITIDLGTNNFGTFMTHQIQIILGLKNPNEAIDMDFSLYMDKATSDSLLALLDEMVAGLVGGKDSGAFPLAQTLAQSLMFGYLGFTHNFDPAIEKIYELNPDAQVVVIDVYNMMAGVSMTGETFGENIDLAKLYGVFVDLANLYTREISPYAQKVTHATFANDPELLFDCYAEYPDENYPDSTYMHPTAERLMNEFIMEAMGYDADEPSDRKDFENNILARVDLLDGYVNDLQGTIKTNVVDTIVTAVKPAVDGADLAIENVPVAKQAVADAKAGVKTAEDAVATAVDGVATAQALVNMIVEKVVGNSMFSTSSFMKDMILSVIKSELEGMDLAAYGFGADDIDLLAEEVYKVACDYKNTDDKTAANKAAVIEIMRFSLVETKGYSEDDAKTTAAMAWELNEINSNQGEEAAIIAAMATEVGEETAKTAYELNEVAKAYGDDAALKAALMTQVDEATAEQALQLYAVYENAGGKEQHEAARAAVIIAAIVGNSTYNQEQAQAAYAIYVAETDGDAATVPAKEDFVTILATKGITQEAAKAVHECYVNPEKSGDYNDPDVQITMKTFMVIAGVANTVEKADELYSQYLMYKNFPSTLQKLSSNKTIYIDYLLAAASSGINLGSIAQDFMNGNLRLEEPKKEDFAIEAEYDAAVEEFKEDSSLAILYMRFMSQEGVFIHPSDVGHAEMAGYVKTAIKGLNKPEGSDRLNISEGTRVLSIGDSIAAGYGLADGEANYGERVAKELGLAYDELAFNGMRINEFRALLDSNYVGDAYTEFVFDQVKTATGIDQAAMSAMAQKAVANDDIILVNLGAMNLGFVAAELQKYTTENGKTYPMTFGNVDAMSHRKLGANIDGLLGMVQGMVNDPSNPVAPLMLAFESYGYGLTTYVDCLDKTLEAIHSLNEDATIVLVGQYDMLGNSYFAANGMYMAMGDFFELATDTMNEHCKLYAEMHKNCVYVDIEDTETFLQGIAGDTGLNFADAANIAVAFEKVHPTSDGHEYIKDQIVSCDGMGHSYEAVWTWTDDYKATLKLKCSRCTEESKEVQGKVKSKSSATCTEDGQVTYQATATIDGVEYVSEEVVVEAEALGHIYTADPTWTWSEDKTEATATFTCSRGCGNEVEKPAGIKTVITPKTCEEAGQIVYTAIVTFDEFEGADKEFTNEVKVTIPASHEYEDGRCTVCGKYDTSVRPDPEGECGEKKEASLTSGATLVLSLDGTAVGTYTFEETEDGWTIKTADGKYVALVNEKLAYTDSAFAWKYDDGKFSADLKKENSGSNNWFENIFGGIFGGNWGGSSTTTTYYLVAEAGGLAVSTNEAGANATFATITYSDSHKYDDGVVTEPTCTEDGYTTFTCTVCGHSVQTRKTEAIGHSYSSNVVSPTCTEDGYTEHKCGNCGDSYKDNTVKAAGHAFDDEDVCGNCGAKDKIEVEVDKEVFLSEGTYELRLGGNSVGTYTFAKSGDNWTIQTADGKYVALKDGNLTYSDSPFEWTYSNGRFSAKEGKSSSSGDDWFSKLFGGILGGTSSKTYYLVSNGNDLSVSTSSTNAAATFFTKEIQLVDPDEKPDEPSEPEQPSEPEEDEDSSSSSWFDKIFGGLFG